MSKTKKTDSSTPLHEAGEIAVELENAATPRRIEKEESAIGPPLRTRSSTAIRLTRRMIHDFVVAEGPGNRDLDVKKVKALAEDIRRRGLLQPILIDQDNVVLDGRHRLAALVWLLTGC